MGYSAPNQTVSQFQLKGRYARQYLAFAGKSSKVEVFSLLSYTNVNVLPFTDSTPVYSEVQLWLMLRFFITWKVLFNHV